MLHIAIYLPVSQVDPVQPLLHIQVSGDTQVPCTQDDVQIAVINHVVSWYNIYFIMLPVSQTAPVQPSLQLQVSGDAHIPCIHGIVQIAIIYKIIGV